MGACMQLTGAKDLLAGEWPHVKLQVRHKTRRGHNTAAHATLHVGQLVPVLLSPAVVAAPLRPSIWAT